jgi:hypothetical protein
MRGFKEAMWLLGVLVTSASIISLIQHGFSIKLSPILDEIVVYYRALVAPLFSLLYSPIEAVIRWLALDWHLPQWLRDLHTLSFIGAGIYVRNQFGGSSNQSTGWLYWYGVGAGTLFAGFLFFGLYTLIFVLAFATFLPSVVASWIERTHPRQSTPISHGGSPNFPIWTAASMRRAGIYAWATIAAVIVFYGINVLLPKVAG